MVELLVVITIISILMGLLIPAVNAARESARNAECGVKMKNLALAAIQHNDTKGFLPGWVNKFGVFSGGIDRSDLAHGGGSVPAHVKVGGYGVAMLPWLDAQPTYEHWTDDSYPVVHIGPATAEYQPTIAVGASSAGAGYHPLAAPNLPNFQCPSNPVTDANSGRNSYVINAGMAFQRTAAAAAANGGTAGFTNTQIGAQQPNNGTGKMLYAPLEISTPNTTHDAGQRITIDDLKDGAGNTALFSENVQALPWHFAGFLNGAGPAPNLLITGTAGPEDLEFDEVNLNGIGEYTASQFAAGMVWHFEDREAATLNGASPTYDSPTGLDIGMDTFKLHQINGGGNNVSQDIFTLQMTLANCVDLARPSSAHVDGVNMGFADGANRYIASSIDYRVYQALLTPRGKSSDVPWAEFVITDELGN